VRSRSIVIASILSQDPTRMRLAQHDDVVHALATDRSDQPVVPENPIRADSRDEAESGHHPVRCLRSSSCSGRLSPTCSSRSAGLKSRTSFSGISSISP
jgi:hypothetical protein